MIAVAIQGASRQARRRTSVQQRRLGTDFSRISGRTPFADGAASGAPPVRWAAWSSATLVRQASRCLSSASARCRSEVVRRAPSAPPASRTRAVRSTAVSTRASISSIRPTSTPAANRSASWAKRCKVDANAWSWPPRSTGAWVRGPTIAGCRAATSSARVRPACDASGTDWIDLYQVHSWDGHTPLEETLAALDALVQSGKVRYIGCSNYSAWHLMKALGISERRGLERYATQQINYSLLIREAEYELVPIAIEEGVGILVWSPLAGGFLQRQVSARRSSGRWHPLGHTGRSGTVRHRARLRRHGRRV